MKTYSDVEIPAFQNLLTGRWYYHFNHSGIIDQDGNPQYEADTIVMTGEPTKEKIEQMLVSQVNDKGERVAEPYELADAADVDNDLALVVSYSNDVYKSVTRQDVDGLGWMKNEVIAIGQKRDYAGKTWECLQGHITQPGWEPNLTPALWREYVIEGQIINWYQPTSAQDAYPKGQQVRYTDGHVYESMIDANVWSPIAYQAGWKLVY